MVLDAGEDCVEFGVVPDGLAVSAVGLRGGGGGRRRGEVEGVVGRVVPRAVLVRAGQRARRQRRQRGQHHAHAAAAPTPTVTTWNKIE